MLVNCTLTFSNSTKGCRFSFAGVSNVGVILLNDMRYCLKTKIKIELLPLKSNNQIKSFPHVPNSQITTVKFLIWSNIGSFEPAPMLGFRNDVLVVVSAMGQFYGSTQLLAWTLSEWSSSYDNQMEMYKIMYSHLKLITWIVSVIVE